jgi:hypothetical protein
MIVNTIAEYLRRTIQRNDMRVLILLVLLASCQTQEPVARNINTQEYIFVKDNGNTFMRVLPTDWEPVYQGSFMRIDPRHRVLAMDVVLIVPRLPLTVQGKQLMRLVRRKAPRNARSYEVWVSEDTEQLIGASLPRDLIKVAPHTWLRPNEFSIQFVRNIQ